MEPEPRVAVGQIWKDDVGLWQIVRVEGSRAWVRAYPDGVEERDSCACCIPREAQLVCQPAVMSLVDEDGELYWSPA